MRRRRFLVVLAVAMGVFLLPMMAHAASPVNTEGPVTIIKAHDLEMTIAKGQHLKLDAVCSEGISGNVAWSSSDDSIAAVDAGGEVIGGANGKATISAECGGYNDTLTVTVTTPKYVIAKESSPWGGNTEYEYNSFGQEIKSVSAYLTEETDYNEYGLPVKSREDAEYGVENITYKYDKLMNVTEEKCEYSDGSGSKTIYRYDSFGRRTSYEKYYIENGMSELSEKAVYEYIDVDGGVKMTETVTNIYPDAPSKDTVSEWVYNAKGLLVSDTEYNDLTKKYTYDKKNRLKTIKYLWKDGTRKYTYNKKGLLEKTVETPYAPSNSVYAKCVVTYTYDAAKRLVKTTEKYGSFKNVTVKTYQGEQDLPVKSVSTSYKKTGKKYKKTDKYTYTYVIQAL